MNNMMSNPMQMIQQFNQFQRSFSGNPQQIVMQALQGGRISQQQLNQAQQMATQFQSMLSSMGNLKQ